MNYPIVPVVILKIQMNFLGLDAKVSCYNKKSKDANLMQLSLYFQRITNVIIVKDKFYLVNRALVKEG